MVSFGVLVGGVLVLYLGYGIISGLLANIASAKRAKLPYLVVFCSPYNKLWQVTHVLWVALIKKFLPKAWWEDWLFVMTADWSYTLNQEPWERIGESFLVVSPGNIILFTSNAEAIRQVTSRRDDFIKPAEQYRILALFGENVITTEGSLWRMHRKVTSASFNERNAAFAFSESIYQTQGMINQWRYGAIQKGGEAGGSEGGVEKATGSEKDSGDARTITTLPVDIMTLTLHIIGSVGFGLRFQWPGQATSDGKVSGSDVLTPGEGHTMTFPQAMAMLMDRILALLMLPTWMLKNLPFKWAKEAYEAKQNYALYMEEFLRAKKEELQSSGGCSPGSEQGMDIMGGLVRAKYASENAASKKAGSSPYCFEQVRRRRLRTPSPSMTTVVESEVEDDAGAETGTEEYSTPLETSPPMTALCPQLSDSDIIGNAFIMIVAGHETTSNTLHFTLVELANNPAAQRALQADVDRIFASSGIPDSGDSGRALADAFASSSLSFERFVGEMMASMPGAALNETLRLMPAVVEIPKKVTPHADQPLTIDGEEHIIPRGATIALTAAAAHRSPRYWPPPPPAPGKAAVTDVNDWVPERWFRRSGAENGSSSTCVSPGGATLATEADDADSGSGSGSSSGIGDSTVATSVSSVSLSSSNTLFRPVRGSFVPFSDGARSCLGRRIAQVKLMAALAVIFRRYSVELAVDPLATDAEIEGMAAPERAVVYEKARETSRAVLKTATSVITLKLPGDSHIPVRIVRRGRERFVGVVDGYLSKP